MFIYSHISLLCTVFPGLLFSNNFPILVEFKRKSPFVQFSCFCLKLNVSGIYFSIGRNFDCWQLKLILHMFWIAINMFLTILVEIIDHVCCCFIFCSNFSVFYTSGFFCYPGSFPMGQFPDWHFPGCHTTKNRSPSDIFPQETSSTRQSPDHLIIQWKVPRPLISPPQHFPYDML